MQCDHGGLLREIESGEGVITDEDLRFHREGPREDQALALSGVQFLGKRRGVAGGKANGLEQLMDAPLAMGGGGAR